MIMREEYLNNDVSVCLFGLILSILVILPVISYQLSWFFVPIPFILSLVIIIIKKVCNYIKYPDIPRDIGYQYMEET